jgi:hypothetical protein
MINKKETYEKYAHELYKKGINPDILVVADIIKILTEDDVNFKYNFNNNNIISGPFGELIRINYRDNILEIYDSYTVEGDDKFKEYNYSLRLFDLNTGLLCDDCKLYSYSNQMESISLYGLEEFKRLDFLSKEDFSPYEREIFLDREDIDIKRLESSNRAARNKVKELKGKLFKVSKRYCKKNDYILEGVNKIINMIDNAYSKHAEVRTFDSPILDQDTIDMINKKLYLDKLSEESEAFSKISILPITEIIEEYKAYHTPKTDKIAKKYILISRKIAEVLDQFIYFRIDFRKHQISAKEIDEMMETRYKKLIKRRDELDNGDLL